MWRRLDFTLTGAGLVKAEKVFGEMNPLIGDVRIEDLPIPYTAVAADITVQREVWFQRGPLASAIRASIAIPSVITPVTMGGHILVDGGLCNPVPVEPTLSVSSDVTIAVSLAGRPLVITADDVTTADNVVDVGDEEGKMTFVQRLPFVGRKAHEEVAEIAGEEEIAEGSTESSADLIRPAGRKAVSRMELINDSIDIFPTHVGVSL